MATDLKNLLSSASDSVTINKPTFTDAVDIAAAAVSGKGHLASAIASEGLEIVSPAAADHFSAAVRGGDLRVGAVGAIVGAVKPASKHDADSLAVMANLATNPGAAAIGYAAVQLGGDHIGDRGVGALKVGTALAGLAAGAPPLLAAWGVYEGGRQLFNAFSNNEQAQDGTKALAPAAHQVSTDTPVVIQGNDYEPTPEEVAEYVYSMNELGWGPR